MIRSKNRKSDEILDIFSRYSQQDLLRVDVQYERTNKDIKDVVLHQNGNVFVLPGDSSGIEMALAAF